uniref:butyrophilin subfamily 2 member A2 n=1 Tax=Maylandia zebra TaxID=106582 RepID=UPI000D31DB2C|nr:butyrophilin subfamily 2 member A2 [Maylandia zebra]
MHLWRYKLSLRGYRAMILQHMIFCLLLIHRGRPLIVVPLRAVVATVGEEVVLPCHVKPEMNANGMRLEWARPDLTPGFVYEWADEKEHVVNKQPSYRGRTSVVKEKLEHGDISLKISNVTISDEGIYRCLVPQVGQEAFIKLIVGAVSFPKVTVISKTSSRVVLQCESAGWYPEPELLWLDGEGNLLSAGPAETLRGPDDLYTVSSRVTVEKRHSNNITCRVQQRNTNQSRETHIHVPVPSWSLKLVLVPGLLAVFLSILLTIHRCRVRIHEHDEKEVMLKNPDV